MTSFGSMRVQVELPVRVESRRSPAARRSTGSGASCALRVAPAKVRWPNRQPTLGLVGGTGPHAPKPPFN